MSHKKHRGLKFLEGVGCVILSVASAVATVFLATLTVALATTIVGIPLAIVTGAGTVACAAGTVYFAYEAGHQFSHAFESDHEYLVHEQDITIKPVAAHFDNTPAKENDAQLKKDIDIQGSSKPFFTPTTTQNASNATVIDSKTPVIEEEKPVATASM